MNTDIKLAVFVSGAGSLLQAMINSGREIALVVADKPCRGLEIAKEAGIPTVLIARKDFGFPGNFDRFAYTKEVVRVLKSHGIHLIAMAGFMTVLAQMMFEPSAFGGNILNSHPALLPDFKGDKAVADALAAGVKESGTTIHIATEKLDDGKILAQERVPVLPGDTVDTLWERIKEKERVLYPEVLKRILNDPDFSTWSDRF